MGQRSKGYRSKSRHLLKRKTRESGKIGLSRLLRHYTVKEKVKVIIDPSIHKGMPHRRFYGLVGRVLGTRGKSYIVEVPVSGCTKTIIVKPEHLKPIGD